MKSYLLSVILIAVSAFGANGKKPPAASDVPPSAKTAMAAVNPANIRAHVKFLSSDLLEGRGTGQRGGDVAAEYIATQFALYGLKTAGDNGSYLQKVPMVGVATDPSSSVTLIWNDKPNALRQYEGIVAMDETQSATSDLDAPIVYVGYGINAPEYQWNDYKDL